MRLNTLALLTRIELSLGPAQGSNSCRLICASLWEGQQLSNSRELSPSSGVASSVDTHEYPNILWNPKVHNRVHNSPPLVTILSHIDSGHTIPSYLSVINFNIVRFEVFTAMTMQETVFWDLAP
jgi:hypothetical protein